MTVLLDSNVLIALALDDHAHHEAAERWFNGIEQFATCPITEGALVRMVIRQSRPVSAAVFVLDGYAADTRHEFWPDDRPYTAVSLAGVIGHRQVTDAYLAGLARARGGRLATFDGGLAALHPDVADLVPTG